MIVEHKRKLVERLDRMERGEKPGKVPCPCCGIDTMPNKHNLTMREVNFITVLAALSRKSNDLGGSPYIHYSKVNDILKKNGFDSMSVTSYGKIYSVWGLMKPEYDKGKSKLLKNGCFRLSREGIDFLSGTYYIPTWKITYNNKVVRKSKDLICLREVPNISYVDWRKFYLEIYK